MDANEREALRKKVLERERAIAAREKEKNDAFFKKITEGLFRKLYIGLTGFAILMSILITIDTFLDGEVESISQSQFRFDRSLGMMNHQSIWVDGEIYTVHFDYLGNFDEHSFKVHYSPIFHDAKYLSFNNSYNSSILHPRRLSIYEYFPLMHLWMLFPIIFIFYKKQTGYFYFGWGVSVLFVFLPTIYLFMSRII